MNRPEKDIDIDNIESLLGDLERGLADHKEPATQAGSPQRDGSAITPRRRSAEFNPYAKLSENDYRSNEAAAASVPTGGIQQPKPRVLSSLDNRAAPPIIHANTITNTQAISPELTSDVLAIVASQAERATVAANQSNESMQLDDVDHPVDAVNPLLHAHQAAVAPGCLPPSSRVDLSAVAIGDDKMLFFGGLITGSAAGKATATNECFEYTVSAGSWEPATPARGTPPQPRSLHAAASIDLEGFDVPRYMLVHGGRGAQGEPLCDAHLFDAHTQSWSLITAEGRTPQHRWGHSAVGIRHKAYIFGGRYAKKMLESSTSVESSASRTYLANDVWAMDVKKQKWIRICGNTSTTSARAEADDDPTTEAEGITGPCKRQRHAACAASDGTAFFVHGGLNTAGRALHDLWKFDIASKLWIEIDRPGGEIPRARHTMVYVCDRLVLVCGVAQGAAPITSPAVASLGPGDDHWTSHRLTGDTLLPPSRSGMAAVLTFGSLYCFGGAVDDARADVSRMVCLGLVRSWKFGLDACSWGARPVAALASASPALSHATVFDSAVLCDDLQCVPFHRCMIQTRAPHLADAILHCEWSSDQRPDSEALRLFPEARIYAVHGTRHTTGLAVRLPRSTWLLLFHFFYSGSLEVPSRFPAADSRSTLLTPEVLTDLDRVATEYEIAELHSVLELTRLAISSNDAAVSTTKRAEARVLADDYLRLTLAEMAGDITTTDCDIVIGADPSTAVRADAHLAVVAALSPVLSRVIGAATHAWYASHSSRDAFRMSTSRVSPSRLPATWDESFVSCRDRSTGVVLTLRHDAMGSGAIDNTPPRVSIRIFSSSEAEVDADRSISGALRLPLSEAALRTVVDFLYAGSTAGLRQDTALEVLHIAKGLGLSLLAAAAERILVAAIDAASAQYFFAAPGSGPSLPSNSSNTICALAHIGVRENAHYVLSRTCVAAALQFGAVRREESFAGLPAAVRQAIETMASQIGSAKESA